MMCNLWSHTLLHTYTYIYIHIHTYIHTCIYTYTYTYIYIYTHTCLLYMTTWLLPLSLLLPGWKVKCPIPSSSSPSLLCTLALKSPITKHDYSCFLSKLSCRCRKAFLSLLPAAGPLTVAGPLPLPVAVCNRLPCIASYRSRYVSRYGARYGARCMGQGIAQSYFAPSH